MAVGGTATAQSKKQTAEKPNVIFMIRKKIYFSGGKVGYQVEIAPADLPKILHVQYEDLVKEEMIKEE